MKKEKALQLLNTAKTALKNAYAPYSNFPVGAAIESRNGKIFPGCNVENAAYPAGICAERTSLVTAITHGEIEFQYMALLSRSEPFILPCGVCLQMLSEFTSDLVIITSSLSALEDNHYKLINFSELLPFAFRKENLKTLI